MTITSASSLHRGEACTARDLRDMAESQAFNVYAARVDQMIEAELRGCERAVTLEDLKRSQGAIKALRTVRELPGILMHELESKPK